ncbi:MAG: glycosyltransferase [Deltaproteobacteria bacterium]|nr:glycosyltransferase [Deltaproteobacteria bacterium]MBW2448435.1 glycosyltransferase [Deltaproteobacteria bacterium]
MVLPIASSRAAILCDTQGHSNPDRSVPAVLRSGGDHLARAIETTGSRLATSDGQPSAINFFGPISGNMGLGVAARNWLRFLLDAGLEVFAADTPDRRGRSGHSREFLPLTHGLDEPSPHGINLFSMNPWSVQELVGASHRAVELDGRVNVIVPFWELMTVPEDWRAGLEMMDLVVAPTRFIAEAIRSVKLDAEVVYVPQPFETGEVGAPDRAHWDTPEDAFLVVAGFELSSDIERKNPWALLEAFAQAFPSEPRARLILKLNNARRWSQSDRSLSLLIEACARDPRIRLLVDVLPYREVLSLYATADVYVSLHRAEGLGLGMLEAMSVGTPVVSTGWSGNLDYMTPANSFLVDYRMVPVRAPTLKVYSPEVLGPKARWAEPDPAHAADWLRRLAADPALGRHRSERALADLARRREASEPSALLAALQRVAGRESG